MPEMREPERVESFAEARTVGLTKATEAMDKFIAKPKLASRATVCSCAQVTPCSNPFRTGVV